MRTLDDIRAELDRLVSHYCSKAFGGYIVAERGYHLVRALDTMAYEGWFAPYKPVINYHCSGPDEINTTIKEYFPLTYDITLTKGDINND